MFMTATGSPAVQKEQKKKDAALKVIQESRRFELLKVAKKMKLVKADETPPHTELVAMIAKKKGLLHAA